MGVVMAPPAEPPRVGLIASLGPSGGPYLDPPDTIAEFQQAPLERDGSPFTAPGVGPQRWYDKASYLPEQVCLAGGVTDPCSQTAAKSIAASPAVVNATPFMVWAGDKCSTFGWEAHDFMGRATRALLAVESKLIAQEFWKGTLTSASGWSNRYLASDAFSDTLSSPNTPVSPTTALDYLEQGLADCGNGQQGAIHCTRQLGSIWSALGNTYRSVNGQILTWMGTLIIPDAGYDGSGPQGQPRVDGSQWAYATLMPQVRRSPVDVFPGSFAEAVIKATNDVEWRAERLAVVTIPACCQLAVNVNVPLALEGGAS